MADPTGEGDRGALRLDFDRRLLLQISRLRDHVRCGLLAYRELDDALNLSETGADTLADARTGKNVRHLLCGHALAYNLGNFMRTLAMPKAVEPWSLTSLRDKLIKIGAMVVSPGRYVTFQMAEIAVSRQMFADILRLIARPRAPARESMRVVGSDATGTTGEVRLDAGRAASSAPRRRAKCGFDASGPRGARFTVARAPRRGSRPHNDLESGECRLNSLKLWVSQ
jgi:Transposase DDE domain group 1